MRTTSLVLLGVAIAGCGLDESGFPFDASVEASPVEASVDAPADVQQEPVVCADAGAASCADAAPSRMPALYSPDAAAPCPAGYDTHDLVLAAPDAPTCGCNCTDGGAPTCATTTINYHYGVAGACGTGGSIALSGTCTATNEPTFNGESVQDDPPALVGGCGGGTSVAPPSTNQNVRLCVPDCASDESVCAAQGALRACVYVAGNAQTCPTNYPSGPFYVGSTPQVTCDGCTCSPVGDCTPSTAHLYTDNGCTMGDQSFPMDGQCHALGGGQIGNFASANVKPNLKGGSYKCNVTSGASHMTYVGESFTVCCN
ncbi:MAG TPA: hypothetical protein VGH28_15345 [Polyangiaceae bacterium]